MAMDNGSAADERGGLSTATKTTLLYLVVGFGLLLTGWWVQPRFQARSITAELQSVLFPKLEDVAQAGSLEIVSYNEELAELSPFKVVKTGGVWVLPAHDNYPADAQEHLAAAATELIDMKPLDVMSESPADHETFGVIEPDPQKIEAGMTGVGKLLEIRAEAGTALARLVVGKEDRQPAGAAGGTRLLRFVRISGQDPVYRVEIDTSKLTTRFDDWIEKDLLKLSPWDVRNVTLDDYALAAVQAEGRMMVEQQRQSRVQLAYNDQDAEWSLTSLEVFNPEDSTAEPEMVTLGDDQELDTAKLNDLRNALGDLKIIDVARKPAGLTADLEAEASFLDDDEAVRSMQQRGFLPLSSGEILSTDGETVVGMKDGVEYVLRFGAGTSVVQTGEDAGEVGERSEVPGRYLLVMARFNESLLEKPVLEPVPGEEPAETTEPETTEPETTDGSSFSRSGPFRLVAQADDDAAVAGEAAEQGSAEEPSEGDESADAEDGPPSPAPSAAEALQAADEAEAKAQAAREERRRVERENRRRQEEYDEQVESGKKRVRELNGRFAAWYYIVSDEEYAKIHLSQADVVREAGAAETDPAAAGGLGLPNTPGFALPPAGQ